MILFLEMGYTANFFKKLGKGLKTVNKACKVLADHKKKREARQAASAAEKTPKPPNSKPPKPPTK